MADNNIYFIYLCMYPYNVVRDIQTKFLRKRKGILRRIRPQNTSKLGEGFIYIEDRGTTEIAEERWRFVKLVWRGG